jgi:hypothetical protein
MVVPGRTVLEETVTDDSKTAPPREFIMITSVPPAF